MAGLTSPIISTCCGIALELTCRHSLFHHFLLHFTNTYLSHIWRMNTQRITVDLKLFETYRNPTYFCQTRATDTEFNNMSSVFYFQQLQGSGSSVCVCLWRTPPPDGSIAACCVRLDLRAVGVGLLALHAVGLTSVCKRRLLNWGNSVINGTMKESGSESCDNYISG